MNPKPYLQTHARKLDLCLYEHLFEGADPQPVLAELATYQNPDGGFGKALEPDLRLPDSSVLATTVAFQYLAQLDIPIKATEELISKAIRYLLNSYDSAKQRWINIPPEADHYPRAPWWDYQGVLASVEWGNPSAEVLGYLLQHAELVNNDRLLQQVSEQALRRLHEIEEPEQHEVKCYIRLYEHANQALQAQLYGPLAKHIKQATKTDPKEWQGYVATPLTFVTSPDSPFASLFGKQLLLENAEYTHQQARDNTHWEPTWEWGQFEAEWAKAKAEWSGKLTVENMRVLKAFLPEQSEADN